MATERTHTHSAPIVDASALKSLVDSRSRELGLTRERVAHRAGVGRSTLFDWLSGTGQPSAAGWLGLARALQLDVVDLFARLGCPLTSVVEQERLRRGWTRGDLAQAANVSFATVRTLEDDGQVRPDAAARVAASLGLQEQFLLRTARVSARAVTPLGRALEQERLQRGWTIAQTARHLGTARQLVSAWLLGSEPVAQRWYPQLAEFTSLSLEQVQSLAQEGRTTRPGSQDGQLIRVARLRRGWSQADLARQLGVSEATVEQWESGRRHPASDARCALRQALSRAVAEPA